MPFSRFRLSLSLGIILMSLLGSQGTLASASPMASPAPYYAPDYNARFVPHHAEPIVHHNKLVKRLDPPQPPVVKTTLPREAYSPLHHSAFKRALFSFTKRLHTRDVGDDIQDLLDMCDDSRTGAQDSSNALKALAEQSGVADDDDGIQQNAATQTNALHASLHGIDVLLKQLGGNEKGLANYDSTSRLETCIKDTVNLNKDALTSINLLIYNIPDLGPVLGPIVYDIKCIVDDVLDLVENLTDGTLAALGPTFTDLLGPMNAIGCSSNVKLLGLCV